MDRYLKEHIMKQMSQRSVSGFTKNLYLSSTALPWRDYAEALVAYKANRYADGVAAATINRELACMKKAFNFAIREWEWCRDNPVAHVSNRTRAQSARWMVEHGEEERLLQAARPWLKDIVLFAFEYRHADGGDSRVDVGGSRSIPNNCDRVSVKERRAANHPDQ